MTLIRKSTLSMALLLGWLMVSSAAYATDPGVVDNAKMFSSDAIKKANETLKEIKEKTKQTIVVETYQGIPVEKRAAFRANRDKFYIDWAQARNRDLKITGTVFLVVKEVQDDVTAGAKPRNRIEINSDIETAKVFSATESRKVADYLGKVMNSGDANQGLLDMVANAKTTMLSHFKASSPLAEATQKGVVQQGKDFANKTIQETKEGNMSMGTIITLIIVGLLGFWILIGLVRAFTRPRVQPGAYGPPPPPGAPMGGGMGGMNRGGMGYGQPQGYGQPMPMGYPQQQAGGMGFMGSLMTGMLGAAAGNFMYDRFFRSGHSQSDYGGTSASTGGGYLGGSSTQPDAAGYTTGADYGESDAGTGASAGADYDAGVTGGDANFGGAGGSTGGDYGTSTGADYGSSSSNESGDFGGGGGDFGGSSGGDFGGGGGDFGGGGGDFGGGDSGGGGDY